MGRKESVFWLASVAVALAVLLGPAPAQIFAQASQPAPKTATPAQEYECRGNSCTVPIEDQAAAKGDTTAPAKPYDWKKSFAEYKVGKVPRIADGKPDLQGIWSRTTLVPMERPRSQTQKEIDAATAGKLEDEAQQKQFELRTEPTDTPPGEKTTDAYNTFWRDGYWFKVPMTSLRTSQVVDPPDGRLPPMTLAARIMQNRAAELDNRPATGPEDRPLTSRCVRRPGAPGPAFTGSGPGGQESTLEVIEGTETVLVRGESGQSQLIYMDGRPRPPENVHLQLGSARGHWDGDTMIVEYTNFSNDERQGKEHLIARYKLLDENHLLFGFTRDDPGTRTKPYSVEFVMWRLTDQEQLVEYACHEGNVGLEFTLSAARAKEREEAENQGK
jgi:hypothetical protein